MNYVQARDALVAHLHASWDVTYPDMPIFYENTETVDISTIQRGFIRVDIDFTDAVQSDMDLGNLGHRAYGEFVCRLFVKEGVGIRSQLEIFDFLTTLMKLKNLTGVNTDVPYPGTKSKQSGWWGQELVVPFNFFSKA